jgi:autotransporter adhesin
MKTVAAVMLVLFLLSASVTGWRMFSRSDTFIVGGEYTIAATETLHGNLKALFAQVRLADGARVDGTITAVSSTLDLAGSVGGAVLAVGSDVTVRTTAQLAEVPERVAGIPYVILLPGMLRTGSIPQ